MPSYIGRSPSTTKELDDNEVTTAKINDSAVTTAKIADGTIALADLSATGTKDNTTFLRGDNTFQVVNTDLVSDTTPQLGGNLDGNGNTIDLSGNTTHLNLPRGSNAQQVTPSAANEGAIRYDTDDNVIYYSDGSSWFKVSSVIPILTSVTGNYYEGTSTSLTLAGSGFLTSNLVVTFTHSSTDRTVTVTPTSDSAATVTTPSALDSAVSAGDTVTIKVTNSDGASSGTQNITVLALPTGGTISNSGGYRIHSFTSSANFVTSNTLSAEILIVAGGGGGGSGGGEGGGGGAGGLLYYGAETPKTPTGSAVSISSGTYAVTVGAGGTGASTYAPRDNTNGNNSSVANLSLTTAVGGGSGGCYPDNGGGDGNSGGSGGGGGGNAASGGSQNGGAGTSGQGFAGGRGRVHGSSQYEGGGGGGASEVGEDPAIYATFRAGSGGDGLAYSITGSSVTYAGGGGGHANGGTGGSGGSGGGGANGSAGSANTGGGGGASGGNGGSGIVIIRYQL